MKITRDRVAARRRRRAHLRLPEDHDRRRASSAGASTTSRSAALGVAAVIDGWRRRSSARTRAPCEAHVALMYALRRQAARRRRSSRPSAPSRTRCSTSRRGARHPGLRAVRRPGARPHPPVLVALRRRTGSSRREGDAGCRRCARSTTSWRLGREVVRQGLHRAQDERPAARRQARAATSPASRRGEGFPELNADRYVLDAIARPARGVPRGRRARRGHPGRPQLQLQDRGLPEDGAGDGAVRPVLGRDRHARRRGRCATSASGTTIPVASCECLFGRRDYRPFFEQQAVDVAIIDVPWNGVGESLKIAAMADAYEVNVAPAQLLQPPGHA